MEARITFSGEVFIKGKDIDEIMKKWGDLPLFSEEARRDAGADYVSTLSVEDAKTGRDLELSDDEVEGFCENYL